MCTLYRIVYPYSCTAYLHGAALKPKHHRSTYNKDMYVKYGYSSKLLFAHHHSEPATSRNIVSNQKEIIFGFNDQNKKNKANLYLPEDEIEDGHNCTEFSR